MWEFRKRVLRIASVSRDDENNDAKSLGKFAFPREGHREVLINPYVEKTRKDFLRSRIKRKGSNHFARPFVISSPSKLFPSPFIYDFYLSNRFMRVFSSWEKWLSLRRKTLPG